MNSLDLINTTIKKALQESPEERQARLKARYEGFIKKVELFESGKIHFNAVSYDLALKNAYHYYCLLEEQP